MPYVPTHLEIVQTLMGFKVIDGHSHPSSSRIYLEFNSETSSIQQHEAREFADKLVELYNTHGIDEV